MNTPIPVDPPQPVGIGEYPIDALIPSNIVAYTGSVDYQNKAGSAAPPYDPNLPVKLWLDKTAAKTGFSAIQYNTIHLDPSFQIPIETQVQVPSYLAARVNIPIDGLPANPVAGTLLTPRRALLPNEKLNPRQMGLIDVLNTDIFNNQILGSTPSSPSSSGGFTDADRATAANTNAMVSKIFASTGMAL